MRERYVLMEKKQETLWHENDAFWETFGPEMFTAEKLEQTPQEVDQIVQLLGLEPGATVLDRSVKDARYLMLDSRSPMPDTGYQTIESG